MFLISFYQQQIPRLCTNTFQILQSWWYTDFTSKVLTLLDTAGLCVLVFPCLLYCFEKMIFEYDCYGIIYDNDGMLCSCISSILSSSCRFYYNYRPRQRRQPLRSTRNYYPSSRHCPLDSRRNKSGIHNRWGQYRYFRNKYGSRTERARARLNPGSSTEQPTSDPSLSSSLRLSLPRFCPSSYFLKSALLN